MEQKKKIFPKLKKQIKNFLTDESGEITKKDALGLAAGAAILAGGTEVADAHWSGMVHSNSWSNTKLPTPNPGDVAFINPVCQHISGVVNGHLSQTPQMTNSGKFSAHSNASNHGSHSSGGWC